MKTRTLVLQADTHVRLPLPGCWRIRCVQGSLWITQAADLHDHVLQSGDTAVFEADAHLLIGALQESRLCLEWLTPVSLSPVTGWQARLGLLMRRCWQRPASRFHGSTATTRHHTHRESYRAERGICGPFCEKLD